MQRHPIRCAGAPLRLSHAGPKTADAPSNANSVLPHNRAASLAHRNSPADEADKEIERQVIEMKLTLSVIKPDIGSSPSVA
jgi:hypothetical protein